VDSFDPKVFYTALQVKINVSWIKLSINTPKTSTPSLMISQSCVSAEICLKVGTADLILKFFAVVSERFSKFLILSVGNKLQHGKHHYEIGKIATVN